VQLDSIDLRDYQRRLLDRIRATQESDAASSHLGFEVGEQRWAVPLTEVSEVVRVPTVFAVPGTQEWFLGVANIRGSLYAISDFAMLVSGTATNITGESRLVLLNGKFRIDAALLIRRSLGLRRIHDVTEANSAELAWTAGVGRDAEGCVWNELHVPSLARDPRFLRVSR
jgi:twitching motility protein PilI